MVATGNGMAAGLSVLLLCLFEVETLVLLLGVAAAARLP
jgi:hypothetical protein